MARALILLPSSPALLVGAKPIGPGYPRSYDPQQMRAWADDLGRLYRTVEEDRGLPEAQRRLGTWLATPRDQLPAEARGPVAAHANLLTGHQRGIKGSLRPDGKVELDDGHHRAHYLMERSSDPIPVWVSCPDAARLEQFRTRCHAAVERSHPALMNPDRAERTPSVERDARHEAPGAGDRPRDSASAPAVGRIATERARSEASLPPERHLTREFGERTRERGRFLLERDR